MSNGTPPDAGISLLGVYSLRNPMMVWLLNKAPQLLAETPEEWAERNNTRSTPPICDVMAERSNMPGLYFCGARMHYRYVNGRPAWVCFMHDGDEPDYPFYYEPIDRPPAKLERAPAFDLWREIGHALKGEASDLEWDARLGRWEIVHR